MSLLSSLNVSLSGLTAITTQMQVCSSNIANATTEGYTEKSVTTASVVLGNDSGGTQVTGYTRATNDALMTSLCTALSETGLRSTQDDYMQQLADILGIDNTDDPALSSAISDFQTAWASLEASPEDEVCQQEVVNAASSLVSTLKTISSSLDTLDQQCSADITSSLDELNSDLQQLQNLNGKIAKGLSNGSDVGSLQDERDLLIQDISGYVDITVMTRSDGQVALYTDGGYCLIDGAAQSFSYDGTTITNDNNTSGKSLNDVLVGGSIEALVDFRSTSTTASTDAGTNVLQKVRDQLNEIVSALTETTSSDSFASAYDGVASTTITNGITISSTSSGTFGNGVSLSIATTGTTGTYAVTVHVDGQSDETYTVNSSGNGFWSNLTDTLNANSRLVTAEVAGNGRTTVNAGTYTLSGGTGDVTNGQASSAIYSTGLASTTVQDDCITYFAQSSGSDGNNITVTVSDGATAGDGLYTVTITNGDTTETYDDISDGGGGNAFWVNLANAINGDDPSYTASTLITATAGVGAVDPSDASVLDQTATLSGGDQSGETCLTLTSMDAGTDGNNYSIKLSQGSTAGTYKVTIMNSGTAVETYDNIDNSGDGLWANIADTINANSSTIMATAGDATTIPTTGSSKTYALSGGTNELLTGFFTGTDISNFAVNSSLLDGTATLKVSSSSDVSDSFNVSSRTFSADGLSVTGASYTTLVSSILTKFQSNASTISSLSDTASTQSDYLQTRLTNETGVNVDTETVLLTTLQNAYAAAAKVIQVINDLFDTLESIL